jgi:thioredoxin 1
VAVSAATRRQAPWRQNSMAGKAVEITDANFQETVLNSEKPVLIDFWAVWCGPCRAVAPIVEEIAEEYDGRAVIGKIDVDSNRETAMKYGIQAIPTLFLVKGGEVVDKIVGNVADKNNIKAKLDALLEE